MTLRYAYSAVILILASLTLGPSKLEAQERLPYSIDQVIELIESGVFTDSRIMMLVREACIDFLVDEEATRRLGQAGASEGLIAQLRRDVCIRLPRVVTIVVVSPAELDVAVGANGILRAQALAADSSQIPNVVFEWSAGDTTVADVSMGGVVIGKAPGVTQVTASTEEGPVGTALVRVGGSAVAESEAADSLAETPAGGGKSAGTAAALGVVVPGGGEFYTGNTAKGAVILVGAAGALAAGYFITSEEVLAVSYAPAGTPVCDTSGSPCGIDVEKTETVEETNKIVIGAAVAGALWLYGLIDGIRSAKKSQATPVEEQEFQSPGLSLELAPADGIRYTAYGAVDITFIRIRS
jgi:hypothetical protein